MSQPRIQLWNSNGIGLIILFQSGVRYSNQTGGYTCLHPEVEGVYVPLVNEMIDQEAELELYFTGPKWLGWCNEGIDCETSDYIEEVLQKSPYSRGITVNRDRLKESHEAWIYVRLPQGAELNEFVGFEGTEAILTWENSD